MGIVFVVVVVVVVGVVAGLVLVVERVVAAMVRRPPLTTYAQLAVLPVLPWARTTTTTVEVALPVGFRRDTRVTNAARVSFGFARYRTQHPLGGGTTHEPVQVDVVVGDDGVRGARFVNDAASVRFGAALADETETSAGNVVVERYRRRHVDGSAPALHAVVVIDAARGLRVEVVDVLGWIGEERLRRFALAVASRVVVRP